MDPLTKIKISIGDLRESFPEHYENLHIGDMGIDACLVCRIPRTVAVEHVLELIKKEYGFFRGQLGSAGSGMPEEDAGSNDKTTDSDSGLLESNENGLAESNDSIVLDFSDGRFSERSAESILSESGDSEGYTEMDVYLKPIVINLIENKILFGLTFVEKDAF